MFPHRIETLSCLSAWNLPHRRFSPSIRSPFAPLLPSKIPSANSPQANGYLPLPPPSATTKLPTHSPIHPILPSPLRKVLQIIRQNNKSPIQGLSIKSLGTAWSTRTLIQGITAWWPTIGGLNAAYSRREIVSVNCKVPAMHTAAAGRMDRIGSKRRWEPRT